MRWFAVAIGGVVLGGLVACSSGGGGDDVVDDDGGIGIGADGVTIFWWRYAEPDYAGGTWAAPTDDGGFVLTGVVFDGASFDPNGSDVLLVKTDAKGRLQWQKRFDGAGFMDEGCCVRQTSDGGYVVAGSRRAAPFGAVAADCWLLKTDASGALEWEMVHGGAGEDSLACVVEVPGGYVAVGQGGLEAASLMLVDTTGHLVFERLYGGLLTDRVRSVARTSGGGFVLAGCHGGIPADPEPRVWVLETNASGDVLWERTYGQGDAWSVQPTPEGGFVLAGETLADGGDRELLVLEIDAAGNELWRRTFGGGDDDWGRSVAVTSDGGCLVAGTTRSFSTGSLPFLQEDLLLVRLDTDGQVVWQKVKGKAPDSSDGAASVEALPEGSFLVGGATGAEALLTKLDKNGDTIRLGSNDFSLDVPDVTPGIIHFGNAWDLASAAASTLFTLREIGPFGLDLLTEVLDGRPYDDFCASGTFAIDPHPVPLQVGVPYLFELTDCVLEPAPELFLAHGTFTLTLDSLTGSPTAPPYEAQARYEIQGIDVVDDVGTLSVSGWATFTREVAASGDRRERTAALPGDWLWLTEGLLARYVSPFDLESSWAAGIFALGPASVTLEDPSALGPLELEVQPANLLQGLEPDAPGDGSAVLRATDGSRLVLVATHDGGVRLDIDTDADGVVDLSLSTRWEALY